MSRKPRFPLTALALLCLALFCSQPIDAYISTNAGEPHFKHGYVGTRNLVLGDHNQPIFIAIDAYGNELFEFGERYGVYANARIMSADIYRGYVAQYQALWNKIQNANPQAIVDAGANTIYTELDSGNRDILFAVKGIDQGSQVYEKPAYGTEVTLFSATIDLSQPDGLVTEPGSKIQAVILSPGGVVLEKSPSNIAFKLGFFKDEPDSNSPSLLGPLKGIGVSYSNDSYAGLVDERGYYNFAHQMPPCPGFSYTMNSSVHTELLFTNFHPRGGAFNTWSLNSSTTDSCFGFAQVSLGFSLTAQMADTAISGTAATLTDGDVSNDLIVDIIIVTGQGVLSNANVKEIAPYIPLDAGNEAVQVSESSATEYRYDASQLADPNSTDLSLIKNINLDLDGNGVEDTQVLRSDNQIAVYLNGRAPECSADGVYNASSGQCSTGQPINEDLLRQRDLSPDFSHQGLLKSLSLNDLKDTDIYVFRQSNNEMVSERMGMSSKDAAEVLTDDPGMFEAGYTNQGAITFQMPVLLTATDKLPLNESDFGTAVPEPEGVYRDLLRPGETVRTIMVNRATGYIGSQSGETKTDVSQTLDTQIDAIRMAPPNLKIRAVRRSQVEAGITKGETHEQLIGFEGSGLTTDTMVVITTEWYDIDGSPLPDNLPGYTARLAKVTSNSGSDRLSEVGSEFGGDAVAQFEIRPGSHTQTIHVPERGKADHYYIHVNGQPKERNATFASPSNGPGPLGERPSLYVPFLVPIYDEDATLAQKLSTTNNGDNPADVKPVYKWVYRPEMQFSVFDLTFRDIVINKADGSLTDKSIIDLTNPVIGAESSIDMFLTLLESQFEALTSFGTGRELILSVAGHEFAIEANADEQHFTVADTSYFNQLSAEDFLTISLFQNSDSANVLWEFAFSTLDVDVDSDNNNGLGMPDRSAEEELVEDKDGQPGKIHVTNTGDEDQDGIPNFADFDAGRLFVPVVLEIPEDADIDTASVIFTYEASDPAQVISTNTADGIKYTPAPGYLRLWTKNGNEPRTPLDASAGGHYIQSGKSYPVNLFTINANNEIIFYSESVRSFGKLGGLQTKVELTY